MTVLLESCEFQPEEVEVIREKIGVTSSAFDICRILDKCVKKGVIDAGRLKFAREKFKDIKRNSLEILKQSDLKDGLKHAVLNCVKRGMNNSKVLYKMIVKSAPSIFDSVMKRKATVIDLPGSNESPVDHLNPSRAHSATPCIRYATYEDGCVRRLIQNVSKSGWPKSLEVDAGGLSRRPSTLITLLDEIEADAILLQLDDRQKRP